MTKRKSTGNKIRCFSRLQRSSVKIIPVYIAVLIQFRRVYIPVTVIAGIDHLYRVSGIKFPDLVGSIIGFRRTQRQISLAHAYGIGGIGNRPACEIIPVYIAVSVMLGRIYIPVGAVAGINKLHDVSG